MKNKVREIIEKEGFKKGVRESINQINIYVRRHKWAGNRLKELREQIRRNLLNKKIIKKENGI